jgi:hypothetical protein
VNVLSLYIFVVIFFSWASALERAEPINHHPVLSKTLFLFGYLKHLTRLRIFNFFITPLHLNFALPDISSSINILIEGLGYFMLVGAGRQFGYIV